MDENTGKPLTGIAHVRQSIRRIIQTQLGSRVQRRHYGANLLNFISSPGHNATRLVLISSLAGAILKWEPRVKISHILFDVTAAGAASVKVYCSYKGEIFETAAQLNRGA